MVKIAICGKICSGKTYISKYLEENYNFKKYSFAYAVKKYCKEIFGMENKDRKLLQLFSKKMKEIDNNIWINIIDQELIKDNGNKIIIDDLRFDNEYDYLKKNKFMLIKLIIDDNLQKERIMNTYPDNYQNHIDNMNDDSEKLINKPFDYEFIINNETQHTLLENILQIVNRETRHEFQRRGSLGPLGRSK